LDEFLEILEMIKQNSLNFDEHGHPIANQSHLFLKLNIWMDNRFQTLTIVDLAGACPQD